MALVDNTLRCQRCEGRLGETPLTVDGVPGVIYVCKECGQHWFLQKLLLRQIMVAVNVTK